MNYQKLMRKEKALELAEFFKKVEKFKHLNHLNSQSGVVNSIKSKNQILDAEIYSFKNDGFYINDFYSELNNSLKMDFIDDVHKQKVECLQALKKETDALNDIMEKAHSSSGQYSLIEKKLKECDIAIKKAIEKKIEKDCT